MAFIPGCTTIGATDQVKNHGRSIWMIGLLRVILPDKTGKLTAADVMALGVGWDGGPYLGWKAGNWIVADPAACQLLVVIRSPAQAENAVKVLRSLGGQQPCIVDYTHSLRP